MSDGSAAPVSRFTKLADGCVRDSILYTDAEGKQFFREWTPTLNLTGRVEHADAIKLAADCTLLGGGWALAADAHELITIVDYDKCDPAIDTDAFPDTKPNFYWTAKPVTSYSDFAWGVVFNDGYVYSYHRNGNGYVRAVRRVSASQ